MKPIDLLNNQTLILKVNKYWIEDKYKLINNKNLISTFVFFVRSYLLNYIPKGIYFSKLLFWLNIFIFYYIKRKDFL